MQRPFPEIVQVPQGLARLRLAWGLPPMAWAALGAITVFPVALLGAWWILFGTVPLAVYIGYEAYDDPQFLLAWASDLQLKRWYE